MKFDTVIVGASIAGYNVAKQLRASNYPGTIALIDQESFLPYDRKELSKNWLVDRDQLNPPYFQDQTYFDKQKITPLLSTTVTFINPTNKYIQTADGRDIYYEDLVLATGSQLRKLNIENADAKGIFYLRNFEDALAIKKWIKKVKQVAIVGGGFIGLELAASLNSMGIEVTVISSSPHPLAKTLGNDASNYFVNMHQARGVEFVLGQVAQKFLVDADNRVNAVETNQGEVVPSEMVIVGIGVVPNVSIEIEGLNVDRGIIVNEFGEAALPHIYAAGDVAIWPYRGQMIHIEHWENAYHQGRSVAKNIVENKSHAFSLMPYFWTDQYDETFEYLGYTRDWADIVVRGDVKSGKFALAYLDHDDIAQGILFANKSESRKDIQALLNLNKALDRDKFMDINKKLR
ncbi:NAD(P)/FAD-dependent oxidoreductase [Fundicoccus sp. Sow4_H7]|uniref:NAD(P)/FAD-dependent oxidoreductase n=1 Tax=Fundicoccus sp. Sow4_H7 TaxID=3438784 RepID=UPI003F934209